MSTDLKRYRYTSGENAALDSDFSSAARYENIRLGSDNLFWKPMFRWHWIPLSRVQRAFRRIEDVYGRLCCGGRNFRMEKLVLILTDGSELELHIGDDVGADAAALLDAMRTNHPQLQYGKP